MKSKRSFLIPALFAIGLLAPCVAHQPVARAAVQKPSPEESIQELKARIRKLEAQVVALQKRIDELEFSSSYIPRISPVPRLGPGDEMPRGARPFYFNGMRCWTIPLAPDPQDERPVPR
jgi:hypothetical protein